MPSQAEAVSFSRLECFFSAFLAPPRLHDVIGLIRLVEPQGVLRRPRNVRLDIAHLLKWTCFLPIATTITDMALLLLIAICAVAGVTYAIIFLGARGRNHPIGGH